MKKFLLVIFCLLFSFIHAQPLKGGVSEDIIPQGFFGSWAVISKLKSSNNPTLFNFESRDVWTLSGYSDILILENLESGAHSEIKVKSNKNTLCFERKKVTNENSFKIIYKETVRFELFGNRFSGDDNFAVEKYDKNNKLLEKNEAQYRVEGVKISGTTPRLN